MKRDIGRKRQFSYPLPFHLYDHLQYSSALIFPKMLTQTVRVRKLLDGANILLKSSTLCVGCTNVTDRQTTDRLICDDERQT